MENFDEKRLEDIAGRLERVKNDDSFTEVYAGVMLLALGYGVVVRDPNRRWGNIECFNEYLQRTVGRLASFAGNPGFQELIELFCGDEFSWFTNLRQFAFILIAFFPQTENIQLLEQFETIFTELGPRFSSDLCETYRKMGLVYKTAKKKPEALRYFELTLELSTKDPNAAPFTIASDYLNLARCVHSHKNPHRDVQRALELYHLAKGYLERLETHPQLLGKVYYYISRATTDAAGKLAMSSNAVVFLEELHIRDDVNRGSQVRDLADAKMQLGQLYAVASRFPEAKKQLKEAAALLQHSESVDLARGLIDLGSVYVDMGKYTKAVVPLTKAVGILRRTGPSEWDYANCQYWLGQANRKAKRWEEARVCYGEARIAAERLGRTEVVERINEILGRMLREKGRLP